jgi:hypothetical protein
VVLGGLYVTDHGQLIIVQLQNDCLQCFRQALMSFDSFKKLYVCFILQPNI